MPREASSSSSAGAAASSSPAVAGPGPSTGASRSATGSAASSTRSSPANDLFRITLPEPIDRKLGNTMVSDPFVAAALERLAPAGQAQLQDILEDAGNDLKAQIARIGSSHLTNERKKQMVDDLVRQMKELALLQERSVKVQAMQEAELARTILIAKSENGAGPSGSSSAILSLSSPGTGTSNTSSSFSSTSSASSTTASASHSSTSLSSTAENDDNDSSTEEDGHPLPAPRSTKADGKGIKSKSGKLPPSLDTSSNVSGNRAKPGLSTLKKSSKDDDLSSSPSTPTPAQVRRGRSETITLPPSVSTSSAFPDTVTPSASSHSKSKSSESTSANASASQSAGMEKQRPKGTTKSAMSSPPDVARPELLAGMGVSSSSGSSTAHKPKTANATTGAVKNVPAPTTTPNLSQNQKVVQQRPAAVVAPPPVPFRGNSTTNVNGNNAKKAPTQQNQSQNSSTGSALKSPPVQHVSLQSQQQAQPVARSVAQPQTQHPHQQKKAAQDDSILVIRPKESAKESGNASQMVNHKLWIPPKPPHMQSSAHSHTATSSSVVTASTATKHGKDTKEDKDTKENKEKKQRPVSFASQSAGSALSLLEKDKDITGENVTAKVLASVPDTPKQGEGTGAEKNNVKDGAKGGVSSAANTAPLPTNVVVTSAQSSKAEVSVTTPPVLAPGACELDPVENVKETQVVTSAPLNSATKEKVTSSPPQTSSVALSTSPKVLSKTPLPTLSASVPSTPMIHHSGLSSASSSEAATADIERERIRAEKALLSPARANPALASSAPTKNANDGKPQLQSSMSTIQPHAHSHAHAYTPPLQQLSQKGVSADQTNSSHLYLYSSFHANTNSNLSGGAGSMNSSTSGSTVTSPFSPLSMANGFPTSSAATSAASSRAISRHASSSSSDPYAQKDNQALSHVPHAHGYHRDSNKEKDKLAQQAVAVMIGAQPPTQANMFWQPTPSEREREQRDRERERDRSHGRTPSANTSSSASAASSRSSSVSRNDGPAFGGFDSSTIRFSSRPGQGGNGNGNLGLDTTFSPSLMESAPILDRAPSNASGGNGKQAKIWIPSQAKDLTPKPPRRADRDREASGSASSPPIHPLALTMSSMSSSTTSTSLVPSTVPNAQAQFYAVAERAREERLRLRANEFHSRAEVIAVFQRRVEDLMAEFAEALVRADDYEKFGSSSALTKLGSS